METLRDQVNRPIPGAKVYVYDFDGNEASLTSDGVTPLAQPVLSDAFGTYNYHAATGYYTEDVFLGSARVWKQANVAIGNPGADLALRSDLAAGGVPLIGLGSGSTLSDIIRINAASYGFRPGRTAAQNLAALTSAISAAAGGAHPVVIDIPPGNYGMDPLGIVTPNIWIDGHGSTILGTAGGAPLSVSPAAFGFKLKNVRIVADTSQALITLNSSGGGLHNIDLVKTGAGDGYMAMTEQTTDNVFLGLRFSGGNGMFIEGQRLLFSDIHGIGRAAGGDDFLVLKARNFRTSDINIVGVSAKNYANGLAIGGEVGTLGAASAGRVGRVENVSVRGMVLTECTYGLFAKPGAVDGTATPDPTAYDWRDGLFRGFDIEMKIHDATGAKLARAVVIAPARNALVERGKVKVVGEGRFAATADIECWAHIFCPNSTTWTAGGAGGIVRGVDLDVTGTDIYGGVDNAGPSPGNPAYHGVFIEKQAPAVGTIERIRITADIDGTKHSGVVISPGIASGEVKVERALLRNIANNPGAAAGGIHAESVIRAPGENEIHMANVGSKPIYRTATGDVIGRTMTVDLAAAAGVDARAYRQMPHDAWLRKASAVAKDAVGASGAVYLAIEVRAVNGTRYDGTALAGNPITTFDTTATAIVAEALFDFPGMPLAGGAYDDRFLKSGAAVRAYKSNTGGGQPFVGSIDLHFVQIGPRV